MLPTSEAGARPEGVIWGLQRRLMLLLLLPLGLVGLVSFWLHYQSAGTAALQQDQQLLRLVPLLGDFCMARMAPMTCGSSGSWSPLTDPASRAPPRSESPASSTPPPSRSRRAMTPVRAPITPASAQAGTSPSGGASGKRSV